MAASLEQVQFALGSERDWLLKQPHIQGAHEGYDSNGLACAFVLCAQPSAETKQAIRQRLNVPVEFVEGIEIRPH